MIANRLKELRSTRGNSQEGMAAVADVSQRTWSGWERDDPAQMIALANLARHYNVSADYLLGLTDDPARVSRVAATDYARLMLELMAQMSPDGQSEAVAIVRILSESERRRRAEIDILASILDYIEHHLGAGSVDILTDAVSSTPTPTAAGAVGHLHLTQEIIDAIHAARARLEQDAQNLAPQLKMPRSA